MVLLTAFATAIADDVIEHGRIGLSASLQGGQLDILLPSWLSNEFVIIPAFGLTHVADAADDIRVGVAFRYNFRKGTSVPYLGARFAFLMLLPESGDSQTDIVAGPFFGGEYFINKHFSFGVEGQINAAKSAEDSFRFNNPNKTNINTAAAIFGTFYF